MKKSKKCATYVAEQIRPQCDHLTSIQRLTCDIGGPFGHLIEAIWNSYEHGEAKHIWIMVNGRGLSYEISIVDDGKGMNAYRRQRSLNLAMTAEVQVGRNYQDLGLKRLAADFKHVTVHTVNVDVCSSDLDSYPMWTMDYDFDTLFSILAGKTEGTIEAKPSPPNFLQMDLPEGSTGTKIHLKQPREGRRHFTAEKIRKDLPDCLPPQVADRVYVNGLPLEKRQIVGEPFKMVIDAHPHLGRVGIDLYVPTTRTMRDQLKIGPFEGVCDWRKFYSQIPEEVVGEKLNILLDGVFGTIYVEAFKGFVTASRQDFEASLFSNSLLLKFVDFMEREVCDPLQQLLGMIQQTEVNKRDQRLLDQLRKYAGALGGKEDRGVAKPSILPLDTSFIEVLPSQSRPIEIKVDKYDPDLKLAWEISSCGGRTEVSAEGRSVRYWPGAKVGGYDLVCYYVDEPKTRARVEISIVSEKKLRIHPQRVTVYPGRTKRLMAVNWEDCSSGAENLRWRIDPKEDKEGRFISTIMDRKRESETACGPEAVYCAGSKLGTYRVELFDKNNRRVVAVCDITVAEPLEKKESGGRSHDVIVIDGSRYHIDFDRMATYHGLSRLFRGSHRDVVEIRINRLHPACKHAERCRGDDGLLELALNQLLMLHIEDRARLTGESLSSTEITRRFGDLYRTMVEEYERRDS